VRYSDKKLASTKLLDRYNFKRNKMVCFLLGGEIAFNA